MNARPRADVCGRGGGGRHAGKSGTGNGSQPKASTPTFTLSREDQAMKFDDMFQSKYLKKEDLNGPTTVKIAKVAIEEIKGDNGMERKATLHFFGTLKPMILNVGNGLAIKESYGDDTDAWVGKPVELYVDPNVMFQSKRVGGLRVRVPSGNGHTSSPVVMSWAHAQKRAGEAGISVDDLKAKLKARGIPSPADPRLTTAVLEIIGEAKASVPGDSFEGPAHGEDIPFAWLAPLLLSSSMLLGMFS